MLTRLPIVVTLTVIAAPLAAQDASDRELRVGVREQMRQVVRDHTEVRGGPRAYQGRDRGPEQTERFSRKVRLGRDGRFTIENIAGTITVSTGSGDEVSIEAVKRTRGDRGRLASVHVVVDERPRRVEVRADHTGRQRRIPVD